MKNNESKQNLIASLLAILIGLLIGFIVILIANPSQAFRAMGIMMSGGFYKGLRSTGQVLYSAIPIMMTGLSVAFAFKWSIYSWWLCGIIFSQYALSNCT